jgi:hypothetical protein
LFFYVFTHFAENLSLYNILGKGVSKACGENVASLVIIVAGVTLNPDEANLVNLGKRIEPFPKIGVLKLISSPSPSGGAPGLNPAEKEGVYQIF